MDNVTAEVEKDWQAEKQRRLKPTANDNGENLVASDVLSTSPAISTPEPWREKRRTRAAVVVESKGSLSSDLPVIAAFKLLPGWHGLSGTRLNGVSFYCALASTRLGVHSGLCSKSKNLSRVFSSFSCHTAVNQMSRDVMESLPARRHPRLAASQ